MAVRLLMHPRFRAATFVVVCLAAFFTGCPRGAGQQDLSSLPSLTTADPQAEADMRAARDAADAGSPDAERLYRQFLERHPSDPLVPLAHLGLGRVLLANGQIEPALEQFAIVAQSSDERVAEAGRFYRGVALHLGGQSAEALTLLLPLIGRTVDPEETTLLLRTIAAAAQREQRIVVALSALDRLAGSDDLDANERAQATSDARGLVQQADPSAIALAYEELPRDGVAWPEVALRAIRIAFDAGDMPRVSAIVAEVRSRNIQLSEELAELAVRAERTEHADPNVIGAIVPMTGRARDVGQRAVRGLMLASGTPSDGPPSPDAPQLVLRDDGGDPERAARAVEDLVSVHRAIAIVGPLEGEAARRAAARAQALGVPLIALAPEGQVTSAGELAFRIFPSPEDEAAALVSAARARGATRYAVLHSTSGYGQRMRTAFAAAVVSAGGQLVATETYDPAATSFGDVVSRLSAHQFDALFVPDAANRVALIAPALASGGLWSVAQGQQPPRGARAITLLLPSVAIDPRVARSTSRYLQGALFASSFHPAATSAEGMQFIDAFVARFGEAPDAFAATSFDAFNLVRRAVASGARTRSEVAAWLRASGRMTTVGASGGLSPNRTPAQGSAVLELRGESLARFGVPSS